MREIFANNATDKGLISKIFISYNSTKKKNFLMGPPKKQTEDLNRHFSKGNIQMANRHMKKMLKLAVIREMLGLPLWPSG